MNNTRYSHHGVSSALHLGNLVVDSDSYRQSGVNSELWRVKDFKSDAKVMAGCLYPTLKMIADAIQYGRWDTTVEDDGVLTCALLFMRLHTYAVNGKDVPVKHHVLYLWTSMIFFTSMGCVNITPRRNVVSELITNFFMVLISDMFKPWLLTGEPAEHGFGNMIQVQCEFTCLMIVCIIEKDMHRTEHMFRGNLRPKRAKVCGYFESYEEWVNI